MTRIALLLGALLAFGCGVGGVDKEALMDPKSDAMKEQAPDQFTALFETSAGNFKIQVTRDWAPRGADRFYTWCATAFSTSWASSGWCRVSWYSGA